MFRERLTNHQFNVPITTAENEERNTFSNIMSIQFQNSDFSLMYIFKQGLLRCRQITWKIPLLRLIFFDKITDCVLANLPKIRSLACIFYGFRSCYLSKFHDILGKVIPWKTFRLRAADRCNVFKMFIPTKILYIQGRTLESKKTQDV